MCLFRLVRRENVEAEWIAKREVTKLERGRRRAVGATSEQSAGDGFR